MAAGGADDDGVTLEELVKVRASFFLSFFLSFFFFFSNAYRASRNELSLAAAFLLLLLLLLERADACFERTRDRTTAT